MSGKRKWDQPGPESDQISKAAKPSEDTKTASDAAAAAAAIAAKIAAQFSANPTIASGEFDGAFFQDIDINDMRNRYLLIKASTQQEINEATGASIATKGQWYPDRSKATEKDPALYLHVTAASQDKLDAAVGKINEFIAMDMGSLVEDKTKGPREKRKWPEEKLVVGLESIRNFNVRAKVVGPTGLFVKYIQQETGTRVQIKGAGSGFIEQETGRESEEPMHIHITGPEDGQLARAKALTEDLLEVVRSEHAKQQAVLMTQQSAMQGGQGGYGGYMGYGSQGAGGDASGQTGSMEQYAAYWAAYGYDVNSAEFKQWMASQAQQSQQAGYGQPAPPSAPAPAPPTEAPPPPPPPPS